MDKKSKALIGVGVIAATAYLISMNNKSTEQTFGSGNFGGLGGGGLESIEGVTDSGTPYNITFPQIDPSPIIKLIDQPVSSGRVDEDGDVITTVTEKVSTPTTTKKSALSQDRIEQSGSFTTSLAQIFGTEDQKTNIRGDYYTTPAGGGAGAIKGKSIGEMVTSFLSQSYEKSKTYASNIPTGATTAVDPKYSISSDAIAALQAEQARKAEIQEAIDKFNIATYSSGSGSGVKETLQTTKKEATTKKVVSLQEAASRSYNDLVSKTSSSSSKSVGSSTTSTPTTKKKVISLEQAKRVRRD